MKECGRCHEEKPPGEFYKDRSQPDGLDRRCKKCAKGHLAEVKARKGEEWAERRRKRHKERMATDPEYRERMRRQSLERQRRYRQTPEGRAKIAEYTRARYYRVRSDPELWAEFLRKKREYMLRLIHEDPDRYQAILEARRINHRLKRLREGKPVRESKMKPNTGRSERVDAAPLVPLIEEWIRVYRLTHGEAEDDNGHSAPAIAVLAERAGVSTKIIYKIRKGQEQIAMNSADGLCIALDIPFALIYSDKDDDD